MVSAFAVAVRELVAFVHRSGDIDHRFTPSPSAAQGIEGHQCVYRRRPSSYQREYGVELTRHCAGVELRVRGRADGYDPAAGVVEEIKTCRVAPEDIPASVTRLHLAQAKVYAAIIAAQQDLAEVTVRLTWLDIDADRETPVEAVCSAAELDAFLAHTLDSFSDWLARVARQRQRRDLSLAGLAFPHGEFRPGQRDIAELVYKCIDQGGELMLEAPTGIGKTAATLYPALRALERGKHDGVIYATARTVGRRAAEQCMALLDAAGLEMPWLSLSAKDSVCLAPGKACHPLDCPFAAGYYDRLGAALAAALEAGALPRDTLVAIAQEHGVCPYQLADDLLPWIDMYIADLHYLYSLSPRLGQLAQQQGRRYSVLLDEAHNLPERARGMYRGRLEKAQLMRAKAEAPKPLRRALERVNRCLLALQREHWQAPDYDCRETLPEKLQYALLEVAAVASEQLAVEPALLQRQPVLAEFYFALLQWLRLAEYWGDDFRFELERGSGPQSLVLQLNCLDPSRLLGAGHARLHAVIAFSATLSPLPWMRQMLGLQEAAVCRRLASPFAPSQLVVQLATGVDTRYRARAASLASLAALLQTWLASTAGNGIVYFPSYSYMREALALLDLGSRPLWLQLPGQDVNAREALLARFATERNLVAFCILGGVFGEGIDLPGEQLHAVAVVGVGLPQVGRQREQLRAWYQQRYGLGFEYAYLYPGMQKVDQALGRVIRTTEDRGQALLIDSRYAWQQYRELLPRWWDYRQYEP